MNFDWTLLLAQTVLFFFPAYIANLSPIVFSKVRILRKLFELPLDGGKTLGANRLFGRHKTVGGFIFGTLGGVFGTFISLMFFILTVRYFGDLLFVVIPKVIIEYLFLGLILGLGAMTGDLLKSFIKRRLSIAEGKPWWIFDQNDFVVGAWVFSGLLIPYSETWQLFLVALIITPPLHFMANLLAFKFKLKDVWW
jgi:CDP-2,3-bis-(O-geranylgeranyl)-sn-glycerol synthase